MNPVYLSTIPQRRFDSSSIDDTVAQSLSFKEELNKWAQKEGGEALEAARLILDAYERKSITLELCNYNLKTLPPEIGKLTCLEYLGLSHNKLTELPPEIGNLTGLTFFSLHNNKLTKLPPEIGNLTALTALDLYNNKLTGLPSEVGNLTDLNTLDLYDNELTDLPPEIGKLTALTSLRICNNKLTRLPSEIANLTALGCLDVSDNQLTALPPQIDHLTALIHLHLLNNQLTALPPQIGNLTALRELILCNNKLSGLPPEIGNLTALKGLDVTDNQLLRDLPLSLGSLVNITDLDISGTQIPQQTCDAILTACKAARGCLASKHRLKQKINLWQQVSQKQYSLEWTSNLGDDHKKILYEWLIRLEKTNDFRGVHQQSLTQIVCSILEFAGKSAEFSDQFFAQAEVNNTACGDRAAMALNEIFLSWKLGALDKESPMKDRLELLEGAAKTLALRTELAKRIEAREKETGAALVEDVEIYLYYESAFQKRLGLLSAIQGMLYGAMGKSDWIKEEALINDIENTYLDRLADLPQLRDMLQDDEEFQKKLDLEKEKLQEDLEAIDQAALSSDEYNASSKKLMAQFKHLEKTTAREWFEQKKKSLF